MTAGQVVPDHILVVVLADFPGLGRRGRGSRRRGSLDRGVRGEADAHAPSSRVVDGVVFPQGRLPQHPEGAERSGKLEGLDGDGAVVTGDLGVVLTGEDHLEGPACCGVEREAQGRERGPAGPDSLQQSVHLRWRAHHHRSPRIQSDPAARVSARFVAKAKRLAVHKDVAHRHYPVSSCGVGLAAKHGQPVQAVFALCQPLWTEAAEGDLAVLVGLQVPQEDREKRLGCGAICLHPQHEVEVGAHGQAC
mmetsp:Transcript_51033/g.160106  ORF Transcript_51033/g.160106 Transcript_51033/m.160106 type:complete len:249 (+) Transcript_51033:431-1177(+)